jgi:hypothetical protein
MSQGKTGWFLRIAVGFIVCLSASVRADSLGLYLDNDGRWFKPNHHTDRHYTSGVKVVYGFRPDWPWLEDFGRWDFPFFPADSQEVTTAVGLFFGQNIYTPDRTDEPQKRHEEDMKYAGWLYTGLFVQRAARTVMDQVELNVGVIGPSAHGRQSQNCTHQVLGGNKAIGWEDQINDEAAVNGSWMRRQRLTGGWLGPGENHDFLAEYGAAAGSVHCDAQIGLMGRWSLLNDLPGDFGPGRSAMPSGVLGRSESMPTAAYLFGRISGKGVGYNRFLTDLDPKPFVGEFQVGIAIQYKSMEIIYSQTFLTHEFEEQHGVDGWGSFALSWMF